jgi:soluble lytic murein transglycosylase-like protein
VPVRWRGAQGEGDQFDEVRMQSALARRTLGRMRAFVRDEKPEAAHALLKKTATGSALPQLDEDRLAAYVATAYFSNGKFEQALTLSEETLKHGPAVSPQCHWTAGLAAYRLGQYESAAHHFEAVSQINDTSPLMTSGGAFWAARSWMRAGSPERVLPQLSRAAAQPENFYGLLAARLIGRDGVGKLADPQLDSVAFDGLMQNKAAHRAVALWQIGRRDEVADELARAFGELDPEQDAVFAALARHLEIPALELRAAETAAVRDVRLTSLYPVPPYKPKGGYTVDPALVLGFAKQESRFDTTALSRAGARGVMQIMPTTAAILAKDRSLARANRKKLDDPEYSMTLGQQYLRELLERQNGHLFELAAAYNAGAGNLDKWMTAHSGEDDPLMFVESIPVSETRDYIKRVIANVWMYRSRLGEPADGLDDAAAGHWPVYKQAGTMAAR